MALYSTTLLDVVNRVLQRAQIVNPDAPLTSLTSSAVQVDVDATVLAANQIIQELGADHANIPRPFADTEIVLVDGQREYDTPNDFEGIVPNDDGYKLMVDREHSYWVREWPGEFYDMATGQLKSTGYAGSTNTEESWRGMPTFWTINPTTAKFRFNTAPTDKEAGRKLHYFYKKSFIKDQPADTFPYTDQVMMLLETAIFEEYSKRRRNQWSNDERDGSMAKARRYAKTNGSKRQWGWGR